MLKKKKYLIVIGTRARWEFKNLLFGSAASGVIRYANRPVLVTNRISNNKKSFKYLMKSYIFITFKYGDSYFNSLITYIQNMKYN